MTPVDPKIRGAAVLAGRAKLGEQHRRARQSKRDKLRVEIPVEGARTEIEQMRAEIERLTAALREIKDKPELAWSIAVRALAGKPKEEV